MMNLLLYVITLLLALTWITVNRLDMFKKTVMLHRKVYFLMKEKESLLLEKAQYNLYCKKKVSEGNHKERSYSRGKLNISLIIAPEGDLKDPQIFLQQKLILFALIKELYQGFAFYQKMIEQNPNLLEDFWDKVRASIPEDKPLKDVKELANIYLHDELLQQFLVFMLKGVYDIEKEHLQHRSLLDYVGLYKKYSVRVYLAKKPLLMAIYNDPYLVDEIIKMRKNLYRQLKKKEITKQEATELFTHAFIGRQRKGVEDSFLDYQVSLSYPCDN